jgi:hypothetical protein
MGDVYQHATVTIAALPLSSKCNDNFPCSSLDDGEFTQCPLGYQKGGGLGNIFSSIAQMSVKQLRAKRV